MNKRSVKQCFIKTDNLANFCRDGLVSFIWKIDLIKKGIVRNTFIKVVVKLFKVVVKAVTKVVIKFVKLLLKLFY